MNLNSPMTPEQTQAISNAGLGLELSKSLATLSFVCIALVIIFAAYVGWTTYLQHQTNRQILKFIICDDPQGSMLSKLFGKGKKKETGAK